ncbi:MAG: discoidin domain-containing protein, partial [Kiritimatiellaeota bacterium]|nr:discoidin domain-containing protein [Kiritimatiellota bacterium]
VPPDRRGLMAEPDVARPKEFGEVVRALQAGKFAPQKVTASASRGAEFAADKATDGNPDSYWATDDATKAGWLELDFGAPKEFNVVNVQEALALGERITRYRVDAEVGGAWQTLARGTTLGQRNLHPLEKTTTQKLRLVIEEAKACPAIAEFSAHLAPVAPPPLRVQQGVLPLTAHKPARASNVHGNDTNFGADKAVDDDEATRWATSDSTRECWLEVDLGQPESFRRVAIKELAPRITKFTVEFKTAADGAWQTAFSGGKAGKEFGATFTPVTGRWVRLHILEATFAPTIWEFGVYKE